MATQRITRSKSKLSPLTKESEESTSTGSGLENCKYCYELIEQTNMEDHTKSECSKRLVQCPDCGSIDSAASDHASVCPERPCHCNNTSDHEQHCSRYTVPCEFAAVGCTKQVRRSKTGHHNLAYTTRHLRGTIERIDSVNEQCIALYNDITNQTDRLDELDSDYDKLEERVIAVEDEIKNTTDIKKQVSKASEALLSDLQRRINAMGKKMAYRDEVIGLKHQLRCLTTMFLSFVVVAAVLVLVLYIVPL